MSTRKSKIPPVRTAEVAEHKAAVAQPKAKS